MGPFARLRVKEEGSCYVAPHNTVFEKIKKQENQTRPALPESRGDRARGREGSSPRSLAAGPSDRAGQWGGDPRRGGPARARRIPARPTSAERTRAGGVLACSRFLHPVACKWRGFILGGKGFRTGGTERNPRKWLGCRKLRLLLIAVDGRGWPCAFLF